MSSPVSARPSLGDRQRSSSRSRRSVHPASRPGSPTGTGHYAAPTSTLPLKSALKKDHVHPEPRSDYDELESAACDPNSTAVEFKIPSSPVLAVASSIDGHSGASHSEPRPFQRKVGFDTLTSGRDLEDKGASTGGGTGVNYSFTIGVKSGNFCRNRWTRTYLVATDLNEYSVHALDWAISNITESHDELVILRVIDPSSSSSMKLAMNESAMEDAREEAEQVLEDAMRKVKASATDAHDDDEDIDEKPQEEKQISIIVEFAIGPVEETIRRMIEIYRPDSLIVGTRGSQPSLLSSFGKGAFMGSISRWAVARSPVPVIVVRPVERVREQLKERAGREKKSRSYVSLLNDSRHSTSGFAHGAAGNGHGPGADANALHRVTTAPLTRRRSVEDTRPSTPASGNASKDRLAVPTTKESRKTKKGKSFKKFSTFS